MLSSSLFLPFYLFATKLEQVKRRKEEEEVDLKVLKEQTFLLLLLFSILFLFLWLLFDENSLRSLIRLAEAN